jgi:hypothetical protein
MRRFNLVQRVKDEPARKLEMTEADTVRNIRSWDETFARLPHDHNCALWGSAFITRWVEELDGTVLLVSEIATLLETNPE